MNSQIKRQGRPNVVDVVHLISRPSVPEICKAKMLCQTGAYNLYYTVRQKYVTCPKCLEKLKEQQK